ncbi:hypothetical protein [Fodinibius sediminis]|uniref:Uncharacterized protein n=1 Tax=Fodinibius sediminis TaxID=1214077 RepID=A0A521E5L0_9BACT|nr:hypothetical protein [Fodinibius sediminis]SMO79152.1 hypothetical protein SAMN06265218_11380 [Fodinibius sediminis]
MASDDQNKESVSEEKAKKYEQILGRLKKERKAVEDMVNRDYREARRYVRSHPEEGVLAAFVGGIALGYVIGKLSR